MARPAGQTPPPTASYRTLLRQLMLLSLPVFAEHTLHILVGWTDTYLANHIHQFDASTALTRADEAAAGAAVGTISYILWLASLLVSAVGTGSTAIIARAVGARHRRLANSICGQSVTSALIVGLLTAATMFVFADPIASAAGLDSQPLHYAGAYLRILSISMPLTMVMFVANACLRGAGDTLTPAVTMIGVDLINMAASFALTYGWFGMPRLGFDGIAWGTTIAYCAGGLVQFTVLVLGSGGLRLYLHRMRPHWQYLRRLLRIGIPAGASDLMHWVANFGVLRLVNELGAAAGNAHNITVRIESLSYMTGFAAATAAATMVGQSLGMRDPRRAARSAYLAYALGGGFMIACGLGFILLGRYPANLFSEDPAVQELVRRCLFITGFCQAGFASAMIFGGALRGAGDTLTLMLLLVFNMFLIRLAGVWIVTRALHLGLTAVWVVLAVELLIRGAVIYARFLHGGWKRIAV